MPGTSETTSAPHTVGALLTPRPSCKTWPKASTQDAEGQAPPTLVRPFFVKKTTTRLSATLPLLLCHPFSPTVSLPPVNLFILRSVLGPVGRPEHGGEPPAGVLRAEHADGDVEGVLREDPLPRLRLLRPPLPPCRVPRRLLLLQTLQPSQGRQDELRPCIS